MSQSFEKTKNKQYLYSFENKYKKKTKKQKNKKQKKNNVSSPCEKKMVASGAVEWRLRGDRAGVVAWSTTRAGNWKFQIFPQRATGAVRTSEYHMEEKKTLFT